MSKGDRTWGYQLSTMRTIISRMPTDSTGRSTAASVPAVFASMSESSNTACAMLALHAAGAALRAKHCARLLGAGLLTKGACSAHMYPSRNVFCGSWWCHRRTSMVATTTNQASAPHLALVQAARNSVWPCRAEPRPWKL